MLVVLLVGASAGENEKISNEVGRISGD